MEEKYIIAMVGHTAAGKTTLAKYLSKKLDVPYISEGEIKRSLKLKYVSENSLDEELRDKGYKLAISNCVELLSTNDIVIIDASFHKLVRRIWLYDALKMQYKTKVIWIYCYCPDENEVRERLYRRALSEKKNADNQADQFYIYEYIKKTFDSVKLNDFNPLVGTAIVIVNTAENVIMGIEKNLYGNSNLLDTLIKLFLPDYLQTKQEKSFGGMHG